MGKFCPFYHSFIKRKKWGKTLFLENLKLFSNIFFHLFLSKKKIKCQFGNCVIKPTTNPPSRGELFLFTSCAVSPFNDLFLFAHTHFFFLPFFDKSIKMRNRKNKCERGRVRSMCVCLKKLMTNLLYQEP